MKLVTQKRHNFLSIEQKAEIIREYESGESSSVLAKRFIVDVSTIRRIVNSRHNIRKQESILANKGAILPTRKRRFTGIEDSLHEKIVFEWYVQQREMGRLISGTALKDVAVRTNEILNGSCKSKGFKASNGWLAGFKHRHGIRGLRTKEKKVTLDFGEIEEFMKIFRNHIDAEGISLDNVYNCDESGLLWRSLPEKTSGKRKHQILTDTPRKANYEDRMTIMVCANATGSHKIPPLVIGQPDQSCCMPHIDSTCLQFKTQTNAWMDTTLFKQWFLEIFVPTVENKNGGKQEKILLLLDNARVHSVTELKKEYPHCSFVFVPSYIQPMNRGVIETLKRQYRSSFCIKLMVKFHVRNNGEFSWTPLDCLETLSDAWKTVTVEILRDAWKDVLKVEPLENLSQIVRAEIFYGDKSESIVLDTGNNNAQGMHFLISELCSEEFTIEETRKWLDVDRADPGWKVLSVEEIASSFTNSEESQPDRNEEQIIDESNIEEEDALAIDRTGRDSLRELADIQKDLFGEMEFLEDESFGESEDTEEDSFNDSEELEEHSVGEMENVKEDSVEKEGCSSENNNNESELSDHNAFQAIKTVHKWLLSRSERRPELLNATSEIEYMIAGAILEKSLFS